MPERAIVTQGVQIGVETTPGTPVAANKLFQSMSIAPAIAVDINKFQPVGQKYDSIVVPNKEWSTATLTGKLDYSEIIYALASVGVSAAGVQQGATTAYLWTFSPAARAADVVKTYSIEQGDANRAQKLAYAVFDEYGFTINRGDASVEGKLFGQAITDGIVLTAGPTAVVQMPVIPNQVDVYIDPTFGALGTTKMTRVVETKFSIANRFNPVWALNSANPSFTAHVETDPTVQLELLMEADAQGMALLATLRAGATQFIRVKATSPDLAGTAFPFSLTLDVAGKVSAVSDYSDSDGVYAIRWTNDVVYDTGWANAWKVAVMNQQVTL